MVATKKKRGRHGRKSEAIRAAIATLEASGGDASNKAVVEHLKGHRVAVSSALVSNVRARMGSKVKTTRASGRGDGKLSIETLLAAKKMAAQLGGVDQARQALDYLARLQQ